QTSCKNPGRVSSALRVPPPISSRASRTRTEKPARASSTAAARPLGPAPTTTTSSILTLAVVPRRALDEHIEGYVALVEDSTLGVNDPPVQRPAEEGLRLDHDCAHVPILELALLLDAMQQALVGQMAFAKVPAEHRCGDDFAVNVAVF